MGPIQSATKMPPPIAITLRMPEGLKLEADLYAEQLGISLNALLAVSLREYLNGQRSSVMPPSVVPVTPVQVQALHTPAAETGYIGLAPEPAALPAPGPRWPAIKSKARELDLSGLDIERSETAKVYVAPANPKWNCPCGSKKPWLRCHGRARTP